jgi:hypothetical protein
MRRRLDRIAAAIGLALVAAAVAQELSRPAEEREWHGRVAGFVPYDFRPPTLARFRRAFWSPDDPTIFTPRPLGVGWAVNAGRLARLAGERFR